ncbi:hypothetical protein R9X34_32895, partial [Pseudomonas sp. 2023EL-01195]|nr:hypothetical protein [Pseudomonas sp. 2023EL-01195]
AEPLGTADLNGGAFFNAEFGIGHRGSTVPERSGVALSFRGRQAFGDLMVENKYYVWIYEQYLVREEKRVLLFDDGRLYRTYKAKNAKSVVFIPSLYSGLIYSFGRKEGKGKGSTRVIYPDGSEVFGGNTEPNINKGGREN